MWSEMFVGGCSDAVREKNCTKLQQKNRLRSGLCKKKNLRKIVGHACERVLRGHGREFSKVIGAQMSVGLLV